jgi:heme exporter protein B
MSALPPSSLVMSGARVEAPRVARIATSLVRRELQLAWRRRVDVIGTFFFFLIVVTLLPLGLGADPALLRNMAPGGIWVAALLSSMLGLGRLFADDLDDGTLEALVLAPAPLPLLVGAKTAAHWIVTGLPAVLSTPLLALLFDLDAPVAQALGVSLLLGTPVLSFVGAIGAALTVGLRAGGVLLAVLLLPLYVPVLVFGASMATGAAAGLPWSASASLLGAMLLVSAFLAPWAAAAALRISLE